MIPPTSTPAPTPFGGPGASPDPDYMIWRGKVYEWWQWHLANPEIWQYFERFAFEAVRRGRTKISHWLIVNRIRWEVFVTTTGVRVGDEDFKISNNYIALYARLWKHTYPMHASLFTTKRMIGEPAGSPLIGS